jgi:cellulose synthase (UDP-forming)
MMMLGASIAVANEARQVRTSHRVQMKIQAALRTTSGRSYVCTTSDYSDGGVGLTLPAPLDLAVGESVKLALHRGADEFEFEANVTLVRGVHVGLKFAPMNTQQSIDFVQCTFARADSWVVWGDKRKPDRPLASFKEVLWMGVSGFNVLGKLLYNAISRRTATRPAAIKVTPVTGKNAP